MVDSPRPSPPISCTARSPEPSAIGPDRPVLRARTAPPKICTTRPATPNDARGHDSFAAPVSAVPLLLQTESIATDDLQTATSMLNSFWFILSGEFQERRLRFAHILKSERAGFNQVGHDRPAPPSKQPH